MSRNPKQCRRERRLCWQWQVDYIERDGHACHAATRLAVSWQALSAAQVAAGIGQESSANVLFLHNDFYVNVPLEATYMDTWNVLPQLLRDLVEKNRH